MEALPGLGLSARRGVRSTALAGTFFRNAVAIFETADAASGADLTDWSILVAADGAIQMIASCDWPLDSLLADRGAVVAYRVSRLAEGVRLEGRAGTRTCLFESSKPNGAARLSLNSALYRVGPLAPPLTPVLLPACTSPPPPAASD